LSRSALAELPELEKALANNVLKHSAVRELTRVADPETEAEWLQVRAARTCARSRSSFAVARRGTRRTRHESELAPRTITLELSPETYALYRQTQAALADEHGQRLDDDQLMTAMCRRTLDGNESEPTRARYQIATTICERCKRGWQDAAGAVVEIDRPAIEIAMCDAQHVGSLDAEQPARATQDITPAVRRLVWRRDHGRCQVPGCRSGRNLDVHHLIRRADGGCHEAWNLTVLCSSCHIALHDGLCTVTGRATDLVFVRHGEVIASDEVPIPATSTAALAATATDAATARFEAAIIRVQVRDTLVRLGFRPREARAAVDAAIAHVGTTVDIESDP
jgi:hypothetical protein